MVLPDSSDRKWEHTERVAVKHNVLVRYMKAWLAILGYSARRGQRHAELVIVDGFAGRGKYMGDEPGSPLLLLEVSAELVRDGPVDGVDLFFVEKDPENCAALRTLLEAAPKVDRVRPRGPRCCEFVEAARVIIDEHLRRKPRPSFWFLDPFGYAGVPLAIVSEILHLRQAETFITFMVRDINRFLTDEHHLPAISEILGLEGSSLAAAIQRVLDAPSREVALRELYEERLNEAGARYVWTFRVAGRGATDTIYYLIHASTHAKAFREMKKTTRVVGGWRFAFLGRDDFSQTGQLEFPTFAPDDIEKLKDLVLKVFAGRELGYEELLNEAVPDRRFYWWVDRDFHSAINALAADGRLGKTPVTSATQRGLAGDDRLRFPAV